MRLSTTLTLRYETTADQLRNVLVGLRALFLGHPKVGPDLLRIRFAALGPASLDIEINAYVMTADVDEFLAIREDLLLRVMDVVSQAGTGFAFPSRTIYMARDQGLNAERKQRAEAAVQELRAQGKLPFPNFTREEAEALTDALDYPPEGSPSARGARLGGPS
jgi:MscS family membrane protein